MRSCAVFAWEYVHQNRPRFLKSTLEILQDLLLEAALLDEFTFGLGSADDTTSYGKINVQLILRNCSKGYDRTKRIW